MAVGILPTARRLEAAARGISRAPLTPADGYLLVEPIEHCGGHRLRALRGAVLDDGEAQAALASSLPAHPSAFLRPLVRHSEPAKVRSLTFEEARAMHARQGHT